ncbi:MAG: primosomal protein N' [Deltaproteobacteria bacterium GWC2_56_8]|nr:MAG: primosomal protein N' [Deltaproteobacteria bacterium GWB2_55_19]OGP38868.1 MAG: primosomal protein N' [Deltaproteobacteria bacterium GWC2_56_8]HAO92801.1 primosomal protein N' [Deltaproteobacteria bacterium]
MKRPFAEVAIELPLEGSFTYSIPAALVGAVRTGARVLVPFGKRTVTGYVLSTRDAPPEGVKGIRPLIDALDERPIFDEARLKFFRWLASYYFSTLGEALSLIPPGGANIRSQRHINITDAGISALPGKTGLEKDILEAAVKSPSIAAVQKKHRDMPVLSAIDRLRKEGLIEEETLLKGGGSAKTERFARAVGGADEGALRRSPIQAKAYSYLLENGETAVSALKSALGPIDDGLRRLADKGFVEIFEREVGRAPLDAITPRDANHAPNEEQQKAITRIKEALGSGGFSPFLLYGVTGSGKTLVYLKALEEALRLKKRAIILAPEIALTPWPAAYLASLFPGRVALAHSGLSPGERLDEWRRVLRGEVDIVVGARSALFSPIDGLGLIIVDEEHETSYKQEDGVRYNARDSALMLGKYLGATVILGSATPSVETFYNANSGKLELLTMKNRVGETSLPHVETLDMKGKKESLSPRLKALMEENSSKNSQTLLFLNRRGFSNSLICKDCGQVFRCLNCSVSLTMHKRSRALKCHYCDFTIPIPSICPDCSGINLSTTGSGTERLEEDVRALFPKLTIGRMDSDTTRRKGSAKRILEAMEDKSIDVLIGTQMVSKGHHFPGITLAGIVDADTSLNIPDFRSSERTFQLITQAAGRAGRGDEAGTVVIQTLNPGHYAFLSALKHDYNAFYAEEIELRREALYPPFVRLCNLRFEGAKEASVIEAANDMKRTAEALLKVKNAGVAVLGPAPAPLEKLKGRYRWQMLIKCADAKKLHAIALTLRGSFRAKKRPGVCLTIDMDPLNTL